MRLAAIAFTLCFLTSWGQMTPCETGETFKCKDGSAVVKDKKPPCATGMPQCCRGSSCKDAPKPGTGTGTGTGTSTSGNTRPTSGTGGTTGVTPGTTGGNSGSGGGQAPKARDCVNPTFTAPSRLSTFGDIGCTTVAGKNPMAHEILKKDADIKVKAHIYGPFEAGFSATQKSIIESWGCIDATVAYSSGGMDLGIATAHVAYLCGIKLPRVEGTNYKGIVGPCGGHTSDYHFHGGFQCLYKEEGCHSTQIGEIGKEKLYGKWECFETTRKPLLDACGGHFGVTAESTGQSVYHYHIQDQAPYVPACAGPSKSFGLVRIQECHDLYPKECGSEPTDITVAGKKVIKYALKCPCFDKSGSNVEKVELDAISSQVNWYLYNASKELEDWRGGLSFASTDKLPVVDATGEDDKPPKFEPTTFETTKVAPKVINDGRSCDRGKITVDFRECSKAALNDRARQSVCKTTFENTMFAECGVRPSADTTKRLETEEATKTFAKCQMDSASDTDKEECTKTFEMAGGKPPDKATERVEAVRGATTVIGDAMRNCAGDTATCAEEQRAKLAKLTGRDVSKDEMKTVLEEAGKSEAAKTIKSCKAKARDDTTAQKACEVSTEAREAFAKAAGITTATEVKDEDLRKAIKDQAVKDTSSTLKACQDVSADATAREACFKSDDMKRAIADAEGGQATNVPDSKVREYVTKQSQQEMRSISKNCNRTGSGLEACKTAMRTFKANQTGQNASKITDAQLRKDIEKALPEQVASLMEACMKEANSDKTKQKACVTSMRTTLQESDLDGRAPSDDKVNRMLRDGAAETAKSLVEHCEKTRSECMALVQERAGAAMGESTISKREAEELNKQGADRSASDAVKACKDARKADPDASCDDPYQKYLDSRKKEKPTEPATEMTERGQVMMDAQKDSVKSSRATCAESTDSRPAYEICLESFKEEEDELAKTAFGDADQLKLDAKKKQATREAEVEYLGEKSEKCLQEAGDDATKKQACATELKATKEKMGNTKEDWEIKKEYNADKISRGVLACEGPDRFACEADVKAEFEKTNKPREYLNEKKNAWMKAAADACAACGQEGLSDDACESEAKTAYEALTAAADNDAWTRQVWPRVKPLCDGIKTGDEVSMKKKKQISVDTKADSATCKDCISSALSTAIPNIDLTPKADKVKSQGCRKEGQGSSYNTAVDTTKMTDAQSEAAADVIATTLETVVLCDSTRRLAFQGRRLAHSVTESGAAIDTELCAASDPDCGKTAWELPDPNAGSGDSGNGDSGSGDSGSGTKTKNVNGSGDIDQWQKDRLNGSGTLGQTSYSARQTAGMRLVVGAATASVLAVWTV